MFMLLSTFSERHTRSDIVLILEWGLDVLELLFVETMMRARLLSSLMASLVNLIYNLLTMNESDWMKYNETYELKKESQIRLNGVNEEDAEDFRTKLNDLTSLVLRLQSNLYLTQSKLHNMEEKAEHNMQKMEKLQNKMDLKLDMLLHYMDHNAMMMYMSVIMIDQ